MQDSILVLFIILVTYSLYLPSGEHCYKQLLLVVSLQNKRVVLLHLFYISNVNLRIRCSLISSPHFTLTPGGLIIMWSCNSQPHPYSKT